MAQAGNDDNRETIWGINPKDRPWFQLFTLLGGIAGSVTLALLELDHRSGSATPSEVARNIVLGISASFVASGFIVWGILQAKDLTMPAGDILRNWLEKRRARWWEESRQQGVKEGRQLGVEEGRQLGVEEGRQLGREETLREIYGPDHSDYPNGDHPQPPDSDNANGSDGNNGNRRTD